MSGYTVEQVRLIRAAVAAGRDAMREQGKFEPAVFAAAFIEHGGIQIPGEVGAADKDRQVAVEVLRTLEQARPTSTDGTVAREVRRARSEASGAAAAESDSVVGFRLELSAAGRRHPACQALASMDRGLGAAVFRKEEVVVLPPEADGSTFIPVREDEIEQ
jgi:hypothetical protein